MKKGTSFFYIFIAILGITFSSCNFKLKESNNYNKPDVKVTDRQVTVVIPYINTKTKYINVYRRDKINDEVVPLGVLFHPEALEEDHKNYFFIDESVERTHTYDYSARYCINGKYYYTDWSEEKEIPDNTNFYEDGLYNFSYTTNSTQLLFDVSDTGIYTLEFDGTPTAPDFPDASEYQPALIVSNETATQTLLLTSITSGSYIRLNEVLPSIFLDVDIKIEGIVGQRVIYVDDTVQPPSDRKIKAILWSQPAVISVDGASTDGTINIPSITGTDGHDYSRSVTISR